MSFYFRYFLFYSFSDGCRQKQSDDEDSSSAAKAVVTVKVGTVNERDAFAIVEDHRKNRRPAERKIVRTDRRPRDDVEGSGRNGSTERRCSRNHPDEGI